ncbi:MAG: hypothetical protein AABY22_24445, partial [Nanoarchaeota archaeon]
MLDDGIKPYEWEEDKSSIYLTSEGIKRDPEQGKNLGYYHIRAGSTPAVLLAWKQNDPSKYWDYLNNQPKQEYLRHFAWYWYMDDMVKNLNKMMSGGGM